MLKVLNYHVKEVIGQGLPQINGSASFQDYLKISYNFLIFHTWCIFLAVKTGAEPNIPVQNLVLNIIQAWALMQLKLFLILII